MKRHCCCGLLALTTVMGTAHWAAGAILHERSLLVDRSVNIFESRQFDLDLVFGDSFLAPSNAASLFDPLQISPDDAGRLFVARDRTDASFATVVERLTDGRNEFVRLVLTENSSGRAEQRGWAESDFFFFPPANPDLSGRSIESIGLTVDKFRLTSTDSSGPAVELRLTLSVEGVIPEPSGLTLGLAALVFWRPNNQRRRSTGKRGRELARDKA